MTLHIIQTSPQETADILSPAMYTWYTFKGGKSLTLRSNRGRGTMTLVLKPGDKFGVRDNTKGDQVRLISESLGPSRVFTLDKNASEKLIGRSNKSKLGDKTDKTDKIDKIGSDPSNVLRQPRASRSRGLPTKKEAALFHKAIYSWYEHEYKSGEEQESLGATIETFLHNYVTLELPAGNIKLYRGTKLKGVYSTRNVIRLQSGNSPYHSWTTSLKIASYDFFNYNDWEDVEYVLQATVPSKQIAWTSDSLVAGLKKLEEKCKENWNIDTFNHIYKSRYTVKAFVKEHEVVLKAKSANILAHPIGASIGLLRALMVDKTTTLGILCSLLNKSPDKGLDYMDELLSKKQLDLSYLLSMKLALCLLIASRSKVNIKTMKIKLALVYAGIESQLKSFNGKPTKTSVDDFISSGITVKAMGSLVTEFGESLNLVFVKSPSGDSFIYEKTLARIIAQFKKL